jgi:hypothetical protein
MSISTHHRTRRALLLSRPYHFQALAIIVVTFSATLLRGLFFLCEENIILPRACSTCRPLDLFFDIANSCVVADSL